MGQEVESSVEDFVIEEEEEGEAEQEEMEFEFETNLEGELEGEQEELEEEINAEELGMEEQLEEEDEALNKSGPKVTFKPDLATEDQIKELDKLGAEEVDSVLGGEDVDYEGGEHFKTTGEEFKEEFDEDDPLNFLRAYGNDLTEDDFLALFEKHRDPNKDLTAESEMKRSKRKKSLWKYYLEKIGFYNLDIPEMYIEIDEEEANVDEKNMESSEFIYFSSKICLPFMI